MPSTLEKCHRLCIYIKVALGTCLVKEFLDDLIKSESPEILTFFSERFFL